MIDRMTKMRTRLKVRMRAFRTGRVVEGFRELTLEVWGENGMDRATMSMARIPMMMVCLGMHVEKWNYEHPYRRPHEDQHPRTR